MRIVKISKRAFETANLEAMLRQAKLVHGVNAYPSLYYVSLSDYKKLKANCRKEVKKVRPGLSKKKLDYDIGMYFLNIGPSILKGKGLPSGYMLVDDNNIPVKE